MPPGQFLVDFQEPKQDPEGLWTPVREVHELIGKSGAHGPGATEPPLDNETELDHGFCLTWSMDPRYIFNVWL